MDGIGIFTFESLKQIVIQHPEVEFIFLFDRKPHPDFLFATNILYKVLPLPTWRPFLNVIWSQYLVNSTLKKLKVDLFVSPDGIIPLKTTTKTLAVIHDLNFESHPEMLPPNWRKFYRYYFPKFAKKATRIATVSEYSKKDICDRYQIPENKVDVVYNGSSSDYQTISDEAKQKVRKKYTCGKNYFLFVGTIHPRKNLVCLLKAFEMFKQRTSSDLKLLIVGKHMWGLKNIEEQMDHMLYRNDVVFTGRLSQKELSKIMASALALTYVPLFEGFGIPLVEAMHCKTPIITSNTTSMPEIVGNAGLLVNPKSTEEIANAMIQMHDDKALQTELVKNGEVRAQVFSWERTGSLLWDAIQKTIET